MPMPEMTEEGGGLRVEPAMTEGLRVNAFDFLR